MSSNFQFTGTPVEVTAGSSYTPKLYGYLYDAKPQTEIDAFITAEITPNGKWWGVHWENFRFDADGDHIFIDDTEAGASNMGFTAANKTRVQNIADNVFVGVAGDISPGGNAEDMLNNATKRSAAVTAIADHVTNEGFQGVQINFEPIASLTGTVLTNFKTFVADLKTELPSDSLIWWAGQVAWDSDIPNKEYSSTNYTGESRMAGTNNLPITIIELSEEIGIDICEMQVYDQHYDFSTTLHGPATMDQLAASIEYQQNRLSKSKIATIISPYGIKVTNGEFYGEPDINNMTRAQVLAEDATFYTTATRNENSEYLNKDVGGGKSVYAADQRTIDVYYNICKNYEVEYIGFWPIGDYYYPTTR